MRARTIGVTRIGMGLGVACLLLLLALGVPANAAKAKSTEVVFYGEHASDESIMFFGGLESSAGKCLKRRKVRGVLTYASGPDQLLDVTRSSDEGSWALRGPFGLLSDAQSLEIEVSKATLRNKKGKKTGMCRGVIASYG